MSESETPVVIVSSDTHIGPLLRTQLRAYCPARHLEAFDALVADHEVARAARAATATATSFTTHPNQLTAGHFDVHARLHDMNRDGIAAEVIFHGSQNFEPIPFLPQLLGNDASFEFDRQLATVGVGIYNEWLSDFWSSTWLEGFAPRPATPPDRVMLGILAVCSPPRKEAGKPSDTGSKPGAAGGTEISS
jgi:hypothetical protein